MLRKLKARFRHHASDPFAHYRTGEPSTPLDEVPLAEHNARRVLNSLYESGIQRVFVVTGANGVSAHIAEADAGKQPPRDGCLEGYRPLIDLTDDAGNSLLNWCATQPGAVEFDQFHGRLRRATIYLPCAVPEQNNPRELSSLPIDKR